MLVGQALAERFGRSVVPQITERIVVPDQAIDAEYTSPPIEGASEAYGLIGPGRTVFQFKYRDVRAQGRASALRSLRSQLRKDFARGGPDCDRFVLMTNLHLAGAQPHKLRAQLESVPTLAGKPIVAGALPNSHCASTRAHIFATSSSRLEASARSMSPRTI
jgi:hypothetical protein